MRDLHELLVFLTKKMSMTEIYQPVIILHLLEQGGIASKADLARTLSGYDESVQEHYERILMRWPKATLTKHEVVTYDRKSKVFSLNFKFQGFFIKKYKNFIFYNKSIIIDSNINILYNVRILWFNI